MVCLTCCMSNTNSLRILSVFGFYKVKIHFFKVLNNWSSCQKTDDYGGIQTQYKNILLLFFNPFLSLKRLKESSFNIQNKFFVFFNNRVEKGESYLPSSQKVVVGGSVATKIENGPKTNTKILQFLKIDRRQILRIFVKSKILRRSSKIANSSNIFEDTKIFKRK